MRRRPVNQYVHEVLRHEVAGIEAAPAQREFPQVVARNLSPDPVAERIIKHIIDAQAPDILRGRGKEAAAFAIAHAFGAPLPDGWIEPSWRDSLLAPEVPGMKRGLRLPKVSPQYAFAGLNFVMAAVNVPAAISGHLFNDIAIVISTLAGAAILTKQRISLS